MRLFIAWVHDLDVEFDPAIHCLSSMAFSVSLKQEEGGVEAVQLNRQQLGWAILHPDNPKNCLISESMTGRPEDARLISRARLTSLPSDLFGLTQTLTLASAPADVEDQLKQWVLDNLADDGDFEPLLSSGDGNVTNDKVKDVQPSEYLESKSAAFYFDPVTHEISISDIIVGDRLINMANAALNADEISVAVGDGPVTQVTLKATVQWTQEAKGFCNIGTRIYPISTIPSAGYSLTTPKDMVDYVNGYGWDLHTDESQISKVSSPIFSTKINIEQKKGVFGDKFVGLSRNFNEDGTSFTYGDPVYLPQAQIYSFTDKSLRYDSVEIVVSDYGNTLMKYDFSQPRSEDIYVTLELDAQSAPVVKSTLDLGQVQVSDPTDDPTSDGYVAGVYKAGERVQLAGKVYEATEDHTSTSFLQRKPGPVIVYDYFRPFNEAETHPYWREVPSGAAIKYRWQSSLCDTDCGKRLIQNLLLRCRKKALERLRYMSVTFQFRWQDANEITLRDALRVLVPYGDGTTRPITGKVIAIDKTWDGETGTFIAVTIGVPFGTGLDERPDAIPAAYDVVAAGVLEDHVEDVDAYVAGDTKWICEPGVLRNPIEAQRLHDPTYAVMGVKKVWEAGAQFSRIQANAWSGRPPMAFPTQVQVSMRPLISEGNINRDYDVYGVMTWSPRGIDLVQGGEP